jgi:hypothetical protein
MTTRKVTAIEEKVLALAIEYAEMRAAWQAFIDADGSMGCGLKPKAMELKHTERLAEQELFRAATRLLKQRRAKEAKQR